MDSQFPTAIRTDMAHLGRTTRVEQPSAPRRIGVSGRRPEDDHPQIVYDIVEAVFHARRDVRDATGANLHVLVRHRSRARPETT
jgi:hypothetical protein